MRVITLRQPWAYAIVYLGKDIENRATNIAGTWRGPLAIHQGTRVDQEAMAVFRDQDNLPFPDLMTASGVVLGATTLDDQHAPHPDVARCGFWAQPGAWHLQLGETRPIEPIPARGWLGLWHPDDQLGRRLAQAVA